MSERSLTLISLCLLSVMLCLWGVLAGNRLGWEGDDLVLIYGCMFLDHVGRESVYRYAHQPLFYEFFHALYETGLSTSDLHLAGRLCGLLAMTGVVGVVTYLLGSTFPALLAAVLLTLSVPELWITGLYLNTTAVGLPFFISSLFVLFTSKSVPSRKLPSELLAGVLLGVACLLRADYVTALPLCLLLVWHRATQPWSGIFQYSLGGVVPAITLLLFRPQLPQEMLQVLGKYRTEVFSSWTQRDSFYVFISALAPAICIVPILFPKRLRQALSSWRDRKTLLVLLFLTPTLLGLMNLYTGKYLVVFLVLSLVLLVGGQSKNRVAPPSMGRLACAAGVLLVLFFLGVPERKALMNGELKAFIEHPKRFRTHDGPRVIGGYRSLLREISSKEFYKKERMKLLTLSSPQEATVGISSLGQRRWRQFVATIALEGWEPTPSFRSDVVSLSKDGRRLRMVWLHSGEPSALGNNLDATLDVE